jgi:hypothetical protein
MFAPLLALAAGRGAVQVARWLTAWWRQQLPAHGAGTMGPAAG